VYKNPTLLLDCNTGAHVAELLKFKGWILGLGVIKGAVHSFLNYQILSDLHISVYLAILQHLLGKQVKPMHLPLEMWDWIAKYRV
jgi:hypothetical protein